MGVCVCVCVCVCVFIMSYLSLRRSDMVCVNEGSHMPPTGGMSHACLYFPAIEHHSLVHTHLWSHQAYEAECLGSLVTNRSSIPAKSGIPFQCQPVSTYSNFIDIFYLFFCNICTMQCIFSTVTVFMDVTHTYLTALFPGLPRSLGTRKVKPIWILLKQETVSGSGISWTIRKSAPCSRQTTMPAPHQFVFYRPDALPAAQPTASKHWMTC